MTTAIELTIAIVTVLLFGSTWLLYRLAVKLQVQS
jgi:hypothetical protein